MTLDELPIKELDHLITEVGCKQDRLAQDIKDLSQDFESNLELLQLLIEQKEKRDNLPTSDEDNKEEL